MARVIPGDYNPSLLRRRGIIASRFGSTTYYYRTKKTKPDKYKPKKITDFTPHPRKVQLCNEFWSRLPPCKREALYYILDPSYNITAYELFLGMCTRFNSDDFAEWVREFNSINKCWCIHPRDQVRNPYHTSSCLYLKIKNSPTVPWLPPDMFKGEKTISPYGVTSVDYVYNKCIHHVDYSKSPDGWNSHWGGVRLDPRIHQDPEFAEGTGNPPHFWVDDFTLKTDLGIGLSKPKNVKYSIAFDGYPEYIVNWIPIEFQRASFPFEHYPPWKKDNILYMPMEYAGPNPDNYNGLIARFVPPEHRVTLCKNNQIEVHVAYKKGHVIWHAVGSNEPPYFKIILWGQPVAILGTGGGKIATAAGELKNPMETRIVPMTEETLDHTDGLQDYAQKYGEIIEAQKVSEERRYRGDPKEGWLDEIVYIFEFPEPIYFSGGGKYPQIRIDAHTPSEYRNPNYADDWWNWADAHISFYPGWDLFWWYWLRDFYGPTLKKGVFSYCFPYEGYAEGKMNRIMLRYSVSKSPLLGTAFKGGGVDKVRILVLKCKGKQVEPDPNKLKECEKV